jgi:hypothetical protein
MLKAYFPHSLTLMKLRFTLFVVINLRRGVHPQEFAHDGRTKKPPSLTWMAWEERLTLT